MTSLALQVFLFAVATLAVGRVQSQSGSAKVEDDRPKHIFGYPVDRGYSVQERGPQQFAPVTEEPSREDQYFRDSPTRTQQQQQQQQPSLFTPEQQQALLQQHYQNYAQLLNQQQQYLSSSQQQQLYQHQQLQQQQLQQPQLSLQQLQQPQLSLQQQLQKQTPLQQQPLQQQRQQQSDSVASTISLLGVRYSAAPSVAHTMFRTNTGVSFSY